MRRRCGEDVEATVTAVTAARSSLTERATELLRAARALDLAASRAARATLVPALDGPADRAGTHRPAAAGPSKEPT